MIPNFWEKMTMPQEVQRLDEALALYISLGMAARNYSEATRRHYTSDLRLFVEYLRSQSIEEVGEIDLTDLESYQAEMDRQGYRASSRNRKTHAIKSFFHFLKRQKYLAVNPAEELIPPSPSKDEPRFLTQDEYQRLLRAVSHDPRDAAIIELFLQTGMRLSELARLSLTDVTLPNKITRDAENMGSVRVKRKGGRYESIPLNYKASKALAAYLKVRPSVPHMGLFVTKFKEQMGKRSIQNVVKKYLKEAGIEGGHTHTLRHTHATHHAAKGTDLKTIQENLGHASLKTTSIYISLAKEAQKKALQENAL
jgi:site-specific recombinase XerD